MTQTSLIKLDMPAPLLGNMKPRNLLQLFLFFSSIILCDILFRAIRGREMSSLNVWEHVSFLSFLKIKKKTKKTPQPYPIGRDDEKARTND